MSVRVADEVRAAAALVALESTIVAHGLPWPDNLAIARELEQAVREAGATPATIAVIDGEARVGLGEDELERVARDGARLRKAGVADLAPVMAAGASAATTVSATCHLARLAGIRVFATGGIGGVHRGDGADVSSDLPTLAATPIAVVSAGAKAVLDLPRTLEMLETLGVLVLGYGTSALPAFYARDSGLALEHRADTPEQVAGILRRRWELELGGVLVANPIPADAAIDLGGAIEEALAAADREGVGGKALTPYLLARLAERTGGRSVAANRALAVNNAGLAGRIAVALNTASGRTS